MHWSEGGWRMHSRDDFPPSDAKSVRAFIAVRMNSKSIDAIGAAIDELRESSGDAVRWVKPANLHVTLKFLGPAVDPRRLEPLAGALHDVAEMTSEFDVTARGIGAFPNLGRPSVIWVGIAGVESGTLAALAARVDNASALCGFEREQKRWNGHLTIGRVRAHRPSAEFRDAARAMAERDFGMSRIESLTLYRSHLSDEGSRYEPLATFLLKRS
jgi:RNA 2',3'-cyclic 3'-phosphodiesterase